MSLLNFLQFQPIDSSLEDVSEEHKVQDNISLDESFDDDSLDQFWDKIIQDIHNDPDWFTFADE